MSILPPTGFRALPLPIAELCLSAVLKCGQSFRWSSYPLVPLGSPVSLDVPTHEYRFCLRDRVLCLRQSTDTLFYRSICSQKIVENDNDCAHETETLHFIRDYFQLDVNLTSLYEQWSLCDPILGGLRSRFPGIRILRQDPWECLIAFICSSNNNISRISGMVQKLCIHFTESVAILGSPLEDKSSVAYHPFPSPSVLAKKGTSGKLRDMGFGYRAEFIEKTATALINDHGSDAAIYDWLYSLRTVDTSEARSQLLKLMGVGRKVADCVLLMSLDKKDVIPVDTHVHQIAVKYYNMRSNSKGKAAMTPKLYEEVNDKLRRTWGEFAGWAHSVLFTADLKSFSDYGLPQVQDISPSKTPEEVALLPLKRKTETPVNLKRIDTMSDDKIGDSDLISRVKRRRRSIKAGEITEH